MKKVCLFAQANQKSAIRSVGFFEVLMKVSYRLSGTGSSNLRLDFFEKLPIGQKLTNQKSAFPIVGLFEVLMEVSYRLFLVGISTNKVFCHCGFDQ